MDRHLFDKWLTVAERHAGLPKLKGGLWHPYRRMFATLAKDLPITDVAAAGGWKGTETLLQCYQQPDMDTMKSVVETVVGKLRISPPRPSGPEKLRRNYDHTN